MRDPYEFINFFKQNIYHEVDDLYHDFLEDVKILRENHVMIKGHEKAAGKNYMQIGKKFKGHLQNLQVLNTAFQTYPDQIRKETIENLTETLLYERIGTFLRKQLLYRYQEEETDFAKKCVKLHDLFH